MKRLILSTLLLVSGLLAQADEGMWLIHHLRSVYPAMKAEGLRLTLDQIYSEEHPALADAVVAIDGGVGSGSMISERGLLITNHHVAYSDICKLSSPERNILVDGYWAANEPEEIPVAGKKVMFLRSVRDITAEATAYRDSLERMGRWGIMGPRKLVGEMERRHRMAGLEPWCASMWNGKSYLLFQYEVYTDVRLVGAPPSRIGAFGGEVDNWGWPQHKGDFALYRVYGDSLGRPAAYDPNNRPIRPRKWLKISTRGLQEGDFTMVIGFPGRTHRYGSSMAVEEKMVKNPIVEACRHQRMEIIRSAMERDSLVRLAYSDAYFNLSNYADYARWENRCLARYRVAELLREEEQQIAAWIREDSQRTSLWGELLGKLERGYAARREAVGIRTWFQEAWLGPSQALLAANRLNSALARLLRDGVDSIRVDSKENESLLGGGKRLQQNYDRATDSLLFVTMTTNFCAHVPQEMWGEGMRKAWEQYNGNVSRMAAEAFAASICRDWQSYKEAFASDRAVKELQDDPLVALTASVGILPFSRLVNDAEAAVGVDVSAAESRFRELQYAYLEAQGLPQYPDANSTMRLSYGKVCSLEPRDGVKNNWYSTLAGYREKEDPSNYDFVVDDRLKNLMDQEGTTCRVVNFISDNDITGGNSGSPVLNGRGELVGLAFDGNRESMAGDLWFHPELSRTVSVDIGYVLWLIDHYAEADYLLRELKLKR